MHIACEPTKVHLPHYCEVPVRSDFSFVRSDPEVTGKNDTAIEASLLRWREPSSLHLSSPLSTCKQLSHLTKTDRENADNEALMDASNLIPRLDATVVRTRSESARSVDELLLSEPLRLFPMPQKLISKTLISRNELYFEIKVQ